MNFYFQNEFKNNFNLSKYWDVKKVNEMNLGRISKPKCYYLNI